MDFAANLAPSLHTYFKARATRGHLERLSNATLKDIGLTRFDVRRVNFKT